MCGPSALGWKAAENPPFSEAAHAWENRAQIQPLLSGDGNREPFPTLGAPSLDDEPAVFGGHADQKTVSSFS